MRNKLLKEKRMRGYFIEAAKQILKGEGIDSMSVRNIADHAGYSYATLYNYFKDVADVINECIKDFSEECQEYVASKTKGLPDGYEKLRAIIHSYINYFLEYPSVFDVFYLEKINKIEKKKDTSELIVYLLENLCSNQWKYLIDNGYISSQNANKAISFLRFQIPGLFILHINRGYPDSQKEFLNLVDSQLEKIIRLDTPQPKAISLEEKILRFIFDDKYSSNQYYFFIHYTREKSSADSILETGFKYIESFHNSAEQIINDKLDFVYKHNLYKPYGSYIVVLGISKSIFEKYANLVRERKMNIYVENILCDIPPEYDDEAEEYRYTLPTQYVKGYINHISGEFFSNKHFNPDYDTPNFLANLNQ